MSSFDICSLHPELALTTFFRMYTSLLPVSWSGGPQRAFHMPFCRDDGVGLAAPQVGVNVRLMVYNGEWDGKEVPRPEDQVILVNPRIVSTSKSTDVDEEGCLSFQDKSRDMYIRGKVEVSVPAWTPAGALG